MSALQGGGQSGGLICSAEMRKAGDLKSKAKGKGKKAAAGSDDDDDDGSNDKIVRRELKQVFTNGTIVDGVYLNSDEPNHCVSIKVSSVLMEQD